MKEKNGLAEIDRLERGLLLEYGEYQSVDDEDEQPPLYTASFREAEKDFVNYQTARWVLYSLLLILAWGIGLFMLIYLPLRRYVLRRDVRSRKLYITSNAIVYKAISSRLIFVYVNYFSFNYFLVMFRLLPFLAVWMILL